MWRKEGDCTIVIIINWGLFNPISNPETSSELDKSREQSRENGSQTFAQKNKQFKTFCCLFPSPKLYLATLYKLKQPVYVISNCSSFTEWHGWFTLGWFTLGWFTLGTLKYFSWKLNYSKLRLLYKLLQRQLKKCREFSMFEDKNNNDIFVIVTPVKV